MPPKSRTNTSPRSGRFITRPGGQAGGTGARQYRDSTAGRTGPSAVPAVSAMALAARVAATETATAAVLVLAVLAIVISPFRAGPGRRARTTGLA